MITLLQAVHLCPVVPKAPNITPSMARSRSAFSVTVIEFFPPSSNEYFFPSCEHSLEIKLPVADEPVNEITFTSGCFTRGIPALGP